MLVIKINLLLTVTPVNSKFFCLGQIFYFWHNKVREGINCNFFFSF